VLDRLSKFVTKWARPGGDEAHQIYVTIAKNARHAGFYHRYDVADTLDGRFDTLTLMVVLVIRRLRAIGDKGQALGQEVVDLMFADMDLSLHEIGVSENKVGKKVKIMATAFLGRLNAYIDALDAQDDKLLAAALSRNLYRGDNNNPIKNGLIKVIHEEIKVLDEQSDEELLKGRLLSPNKLTGKS
jgi:cytochrome b pre-mRNA-processing protein 3